MRARSGRRTRQWISCLGALVFALATLSASGCSAQTGPAPGSEPLVVAASAPGTFGPDATLTLEDGASLVVPSGWRAEMFTRGALVTATPESTGVLLGCNLEVAKSPYWGSAIVSVYAPAAGFDEQMAPVEAAYQAATAGSGLAGQSISRVPIELGTDSSGTAYVVTYATTPPRHEVAVFVRPVGRNPVALMFELFGLPPAFGAPSDAELPGLLLGYIGFRVR
jgi:hypothetical protein